ncbi:MAG: 16S rRNA (guanine(966)-N(2))-methyltransferase RsmD [Silicimonas sp.]|nr:16S rRNA (guanine(966)-N(2))-methyltransferase RsmD [Silicimonas sp.]
MRIIGGRMRGLALASLGKGDAAAHLRPTGDRVRESLFNVLTGGRFGDPVEGAHVLDLFAGTGALGLEALSRGAASVTFVENGRVGGKLLAANIAKAGVASEVKVLRADATRLPPCAGAPAGLVFLDPPYGKGMGAQALAAARRGGWLAPEALVVWEEAAEQEAPEGFAALEARRYGQSWVTLLRAP